MALAIGIDVGGTKLLGGVVDDDGRVIARLRRETPREGGAALTQLVAELILQLQKDVREEISAVGLSAAGFVSADRERMLAATNIAGWTGVNLSEALSPIVGAPVIVENDANAACWGEYRFGAGRESSNMIFLILGTGLGGGMIVDGQLLRGAHGTAGEFGHMRVTTDGLLCGCGARGCYEQYAAGPALMRHVDEAIAASPERAFELLRYGDGTFEGLTGKHVAAAARDGDRIANTAFKITGEWVGLGLASLIVTLDPDLIVLGGGLSEAGDVLITPARESLRRNASFSGHSLPQIVAAALGNDAGLVGVADLARG
ncbi:MAG: ROK family protein [Actinobacteria bacterium]|nr:ROK family protein [Actinomycetota bacterium]